MKRIGTLLCSFVICVPLAVAADTAGSSQTRSSAGSKEDISVLAGKMLDQTNRARIAIKNGKTDIALNNVEIAQGDLQKVEAKANGTTIIPVYQEFVSVSILSPVQAEQRSRRGKTTQAAVVHQVAGDYGNVTVNTTAAESDLTAAKQFLTQGDLKRADQVLADLQDSVSMQAVEADMPLSRARENLILARTAARKGDYTEAHAALTAASKALENYIAENTSHRAAASSLKQDIDSYNQNLKQNHAEVVAKINQWWNTTSDWSPYRPAQQLNAKR